MAKPSDPAPARIATLDDVYVAFNEIGGRDPVFEAGEHKKFVGMEYGAMRAAQDAYFHPKPAPGDTGPARPPVAAPKPTVSQEVGGDIGQQVMAKALEALNGIRVVEFTVKQLIQEKVDGAFPGLGKAIESIQKQISVNTSTLIPNTISLVGAALGGVETLLATFLSNAADIGDIGDMLSDTVKEKSTGIAGWVMDLLVGPDFNLAGEIGAKIAGAFVPDVQAMDDAVSLIAEITPTPAPVDF